MYNLHFKSILRIFFLFLCEYNFKFLDLLNILHCKYTPSLYKKKKKYIKIRKKRNKNICSLAVISALRFTVIILLYYSFFFFFYVTST